MPALPATRPPARRPLGLLTLALAALTLSAALTPTEASAYGFFLGPMPVPIRAASEQGLQPDALLASSAAVARWVDDWRAPDLLDEVHWTVEEPSTVADLARRWRFDLDELLALNPELDRASTLEPGVSVCVYRDDLAAPSQSVGAPNRGRLHHGVPMPEHEAWFMRKPRDRVFGTRLTVSALVRSFLAFHQRYPDAPRVYVGDLALRRGGRLSPHRSHRSGRDVDLSYIPQPGVEQWVQMTASRMDAEKSWFLIHQLLKTGVVDVIFVDSRLQKLMYDVASQHLDQQELDRIFEHPRRARVTDERPLLQHWPGHRNHMHVRFSCAAWNARCRPHSR